MKLLTVVGLAMVVACPRSFAAVATDGGGEGASAEPSLVAANADTPEFWIKDLADEHFPTRESASRKLWDSGEPSLPALDEAANSPNPERAIRASEIREKIRMGVTPSTDPEVLDCVQRYSSASIPQKSALMAKLRSKQAWKPMLRLYEAETNPEIREKLLPSMNGVALRAARERLMAGDSKGAREFLELGPAEWEGLLALAEFHRSHGSLAQEIERAKSRQGAVGVQWRLALQLSAGNLDAARDLAVAADHPQLHALLAAFSGDPLPWLRHARLLDEATDVTEAYHSAASKRWKNGSNSPDELRTINQLLKKSGSNDALSEPISAAFLLGQTQSAEAALRVDSPLSAFQHFELLERVPDALHALGLDPDQPISAQWVEKKLTESSKRDIEDQHQVRNGDAELFVIANFLERRGLHDEAWRAYSGPLAALAQTKETAFIDFLDRLFGGRTTLEGAPHLALKIGAAWAGDQADRWNELAVAAFGDDDISRTWWRWLGEIAPKEPPAARLEASLALNGMGADPRQLRESWVQRIRKFLESAPDAEKSAGLNRLSDLLMVTGDVTTLLEISAQLPAVGKNSSNWAVRMVHLTASDRWNEAASLLLEILNTGQNSGIFSRPDLHAYAAAALRKAGRPAEAEIHDQWADRLSLGDAAVAQRIANAYVFGMDPQRASLWWRRAMWFSKDDSYDFSAPIESCPLKSYCDFLLEQQRWPELAALTEVHASCALMGQSSGNSLALARLRLQSDMARALSLPANRRSEALALLERCHKDHSTDGSLADFFYPALRTAGFQKEHDLWFERTWQTMAEVIRRYPDSDNTLNTAAWFAARAARRLDEARPLLHHALKLRPLQAAYLDTMAELEFADGNRAKALEWSAMAVNQNPNDIQLRHQQQRFRSGGIERLTSPAR